MKNPSEKKQPFEAVAFGSRGKGKKKANPANSNPSGSPKAQENPAPDSKKEGVMSLGDHFEALRWHLMRSALYIVVLASIAAIFGQFFWDLMLGPIASLVGIAAQKGIILKIITIKLSDNFMIQFKIFALVGVILAVPLIVFEIWLFVLPALSKAIKKHGFILITSSILLFWGGCSFARLYLWPLVTEYFVLEWLPPAIEAGGQVMRSEIHLTMGDYLSSFVSFHVAFGLAFQLPVICVVLAFIGILKWGFFVKSWRISVLSITILSAMMTPPDVFSMIAMMIPMLFLFAVSGFLVYLIGRQKEKKEAQELNDLL